MSGGSVAEKSQKVEQADSAQLADSTPLETKMAAGASEMVDAIAANRPDPIEEATLVVALTYETDDRSVEDSRPVELYTFTSQRQATPVVARTTSYHRNFVYGGNTFTKRTIRRGAAAIVNTSSQVPEMTVELVASDPVISFYMGLGVPPRDFECRIQRLQQTSGEVEEIFRGTISDARQQGRTVILTITQQHDDPFAARFPTIQVSKLCQHVLYNEMCGVSRASRALEVNIEDIGDFRTIVFDEIGATAEVHYTFGELLHTASGERRHIVRGAATRTLTLDVRLPSTAQNGDTITIWPGCDRRVETCRDKFDNVPNFGGNPAFETKLRVFSDLSILKTWKP